MTDVPPIKKPEEKKHPGGRPRKFETWQQMQEAIDAYFESCSPWERYYDEEAGEEKVRIVPPTPLTIEGLAVALDMDRSTLLTYEKNPEYEEFHNTVKKAKARIQADMVQRALTGDYNATISIFLMKNNYGYEDKYAHDVKQKRVLTGMTKEQLIEALADEPAE